MPGARGRRSRRSPPPRRRRWPPRAARMALGGVGPDGDDRLAGADREGGDGRALDDRERVALEQEPVRAGRRVRAVAVDHDVAARRRPVPAAGRHFAAAGKPAPPRPRRPDAAIVAIVAVAPRSRIDAAQAVERARPRPRRRGRSGPAAPARSSRIAGQPLGVLRRFTIGSRPRRLAAASCVRRRATRRARRGRSPRAAGAHRRPRPAAVASAGSKRRWL